MTLFLWVRWEDGGPRSKRFKFFEKSPNKGGRPRLAQGFKYVILRGNMSSVHLQLQEGADIEEAVQAFIDVEGGQLSEFWIEEADH